MREWVTWLAAMLWLAACVDAVLVPGETTGTGGRGGGGAATSTGGDGGASSRGGGGAASCSCEKLDVLLAIDNTDSLDAYVGDLATVFLQLGNYIEEVAGRACSFHFGVVTSTPQDGNPEPSCRVLGALSTVNSSSEDCPLENGRFATDDDELIDAISCLAQTGTRGDGDERLVEAVLTALTDPTLNDPGGCNEGFVRTDASLLLLLLSDIDDDLTAGTPSDWFDDLVQINAGDPSRIATAAIIPPAPTEGTCDGKTADRLHAFLDLHDPERRRALDLCQVEVAELHEGIDSLSTTLCGEAQ